MTGVEWLDEAQFNRLNTLVEICHDEAVRCAEIGCFNAACVMIGAALEAGLLALLACFEEKIREEGRWPVEGRRPPTKWPLSVLIRVATDMGWLPTLLSGAEESDTDPFEEGDVGDVVEFVVYVRNLAAHPGAYTQEPAEIRLGKVAYENAYGVVRAAFDATYAVLGRSLQRELES